jgi:hypothetical protein
LFHAARLQDELVFIDAIEPLDEYPKGVTLNPNLSNEFL